MTEAVFCGPKKFFCSWNPLNEVLMRALFAGPLCPARSCRSRHRHIDDDRRESERSVPVENYGGPGPIIAGIIVIATSLYLRSIWTSRN